FLAERGRGAGQGSLGPPGLHASAALPAATPAATASAEMCFMAVSYRSRSSQASTSSTIPPLDARCDGKNWFGWPCDAELARLRVTYIAARNLHARRPSRPTTPLC